MSVTAESRASASPGPAVSTPPRRPGSIRRTTTHESTRPEGVEGPVTLVARGRDLCTTVDGDAVVLDAATIEITAGFRDGLVRGIAMHPPQPGLEALVGTTAYAGFRRAVDEVLPGERESGSVRYQLIDDLPTALMLSGRVLRAEGLSLSMGERRADQGPPVDMCAGWIAGGVAVEGHSEKGPPLFPAPDAPAIDPDDDPLGWHEHDLLPPHSTRRRRRLDLWRDGGVVRVDCFFRDSHVDRVGRESVVHEYTVRGTIDPQTREVVTCEADWGELPFPECPAAVTSAARVAGQPVDGLRRWVLKTMIGPSTCTHLNDQLRSWQDVGPLVQKLHDVVNG
jgi:hypothetical protein